MVASPEQDAKGALGRLDRHLVIIERPFLHETHAVRPDAIILRLRLVARSEQDAKGAYDVIWAIAASGRFITRTTSP